MPGESTVQTDAGAAGADAVVDASVDAGANLGDAGGDSDPPKKAAKAAKVEEDPDFDWEEPGEGEKAEPIKRKTKASEVKKFLASRSRERSQLAADRAAVQRHFEEQISPLERDIAEMRANPAKLIELARRLGVDPRVAMDQLAKEELKLLSMTPEQRRVYELEQEIAKRDSAEKDRTTRTQAEKAQQENRQVQERIAGGILKAAADAKLPKHPMALSLMSAFLRAQVNEGQHPDPTAAAEAVRDFALDYTKSSLSGLTYDQIVDTFPDVVKKIREGDSGRVADPSASRQQRPPPKTKVTRALSPAEFTAKMMRGE